jgi:hypothetical protein
MDQTLMGQKLLSQDGTPIGKITDVISDPATLEPEWLTVKTGLVGGEHLVPVKAIDPGAEGIVVPFDKDEVKSAPTVSDHTAPSGREREEIYEHYQMEAPAEGVDKLTSES